MQKYLEGMNFTTRNPKETSKSKTAITLLSGGLDSTVSLWWTKTQGYARVDCLTFEYGSTEEAVLRAVAKKLGELAVVNHHEFISLDFLGDFARKIGSALAKGSGKSLPQLAPGDLDNLSASTASARSVWIPARNLVFLSVASAYSETIGGEVDLITGFNLEEGTTFPDNTKEFIDDFTRAASRGILNSKVQIVCPLVGLAKAEIVHLGVKLNVPFEYCNSCYAPKGFDAIGRPVHCGICESCLRRKRGFSEGMGHDPTIYFNE